MKSFLSVSHARREPAQRLIQSVAALRSRDEGAWRREPVDFWVREAVDAALAQDGEIEIEAQRSEA